ncbi:mandelate racemase/muconate lactonizing enzyme family protein [Halobacterium sp. KA-6]|uniref:mandelate racemase/muconate lactonizing enzyme family protein n=1 Tax=Halobacterium sp. KA-6 TaxID=2896368 RepID=UPI001E3DDD61|nr:mandelate racemase/muconate lactonizing enzyme family protein [Halobacterium sp. KA-6]MCD2204056.1 mandelate racemase/muconate lactonizing enzyme family protein [Halobacterium sp. KA-6]
MEVTSVEAIPVEIDIKPLGEEFGIAPYVAGYMTQETTPRLVIRVETDEGIVGWGETSWGPDPSMAMAAIENVIAPEVVGRQVWEVEDLIEAFEFPYMHITPYVGGVEMALWDAFGKKLGAPIHQFFGGKQTDDLPVAYCLGIMDPEESAEYAQWAHDRGFEVLKTKGGLDVDQDIERLVAMHEAVDGEMKFRLDGNQTMSFEEAAETGARLEENGVYLQYLEQPLRIDNIGGYKRLRQRLRTSIGVNEDAYHARNVFELVREDAIDAAVIDVIPAGGLLAAKKNLGLYDDAGISVAHHSTFDLGIKTAAVLQFAAASPTINLPPDRVNYTLENDVIETPFGVNDGTMPVPDEPGLGVSVSEEKIEEYRVSEGSGIKYEVSI